jgi:hypothetical protein
LPSASSQTFRWTNEVHVTEPPERAIFAGWLNTPTWAESEGFLTAHPQPSRGCQHIFGAASVRSPGPRDEGDPRWTELITEVAVVSAGTTESERVCLAGGPAGLDAAFALKALTDGRRHLTRRYRAAEAHLSAATTPKPTVSA